MPTKIEITRKIIESVDQKIDLDQALATWYQNIRPSGGMRLTVRGYKTLISLDISSWTWTWPDNKNYINKKLLLEMDRKMSWPYYLDGKTKSVIFFSSREAMMTALYGDIKIWLESVGSRGSADCND